MAGQPCESKPPTQPCPTRKGPPLSSHLGSIRPSRVSPQLGRGRHTGARTEFPTRQPVPSPSEVHRCPTRFPSTEAVLASGPENRGLQEAGNSPKVRPGRREKMGILDPMPEQFPGIRSEPYFPRMVGSSEELAAPSPVTQDVNRTGRVPQYPPPSVTSPSV